MRKSICCDQKSIVYYWKTKLFITGLGEKESAELVTRKSITFVKSD